MARSACPILETETAHTNGRSTPDNSASAALISKDGFRACQNTTQARRSNACRESYDKRMCISHLDCVSEEES